MSRIGKLPITLPQGVELNISNKNVATVKGPKGILTQSIDSAITVNNDNGVLTVTRATDQKRHRAKQNKNLLVLVIVLQTKDKC